MKIHIIIEKPNQLKDTFGRFIKGPVRPLMPFETLDAAIDWLQFLRKRQKIGEIET